MKSAAHPESINRSLLFDAILSELLATVDPETASE
jgi:hypothetical protein